MNYSMTIAGVLVSIVGSLLVQFGLSESCSNELMALAPVLVGGAISYIGRLRAGGVTPLGVKY